MMESLDLSLEARNTIESQLILSVLAEDVVPWLQSCPLYRPATGARQGIRKKTCTSDLRR